MVIGLLAHLTLAALLMPSIFHQLPGSVGITNWELIILGVTGFVAYCLALTGLRLGRRNFLLPCIVFLIVSIILDAIDIFSLFFLDWSSSSNSNNELPLRPRTTTSITWAQLQMFMQPDLSSLASWLFVKLVVSLLVARALLQLYRNNPILRAAASPIKEREKKLEEGKFCSPPKKDAKLGKYQRF